MTKTLIDGDLEIAQIFPEPGDSYAVGEQDPIFANAIDTGSKTWRVQDVDNPAGDDRWFGRDYLTAPSWTIDFVVNRYAAGDALEALQNLEEVWEGYGVREPGFEAIVRYSLGGRTRRIYGRPRDFLYDHNESLESGVIVGAGKFDLTDSWTYADVPDQVILSLVSGESAAVPLPAPLPIHFPTGGPRHGQVIVGGTKPTPIIAEIFGPVKNPHLSVGAWDLSLSTTLAYDQWVTIDTRRRTVLRNDGASLAGDLNPMLYLDDVRLTPPRKNQDPQDAAVEIIYSGTDLTGTSRARVSWHKAFHGL